LTPLKSVSIIPLLIALVNVSTDKIGALSSRAQACPPAGGTRDPEFLHWRYLGIQTLDSRFPSQGGQARE